MNKWLLIGGGVLLLGLATWGGKVAYSASRLSVAIRSIKPRMSGLTAYMDVALAIQNPTNQPFDINSIIGSLSFAGSALGEFSFYQATRVDPYAETIITLPIRVSVLGAGELLLGILQGQVVQVVGNATAGVQGTVTINHAPFPFSVTKKML